MTDQTDKSAMSHRLGRSAVSGLLVVVLVLAAALLTTALLSHRAAGQAASSVLYSRAVEVATSVHAALRMLDRTGEQWPPAQLKQLLEELGSEEIGLALCEPGGRVVATANLPDPPREGDVPPSWLITMHSLRGRGQAHRMISHQGQSYLEYWQPVRGRPPWPRRGRGWRPWRAKGWGRKLGPGPHMPHLHLLRVTVSSRVADDLLVPARYTLVMAGVASGLLLVLALVMYRAAGRARRVEQELQRRRALSALGEMAAVLAHEIRTPLGSIKGNAQLVAEERPDDGRVVAMVREAGRLERLVNGLLDYARPAEPRRAQTNPDEVAERAAQIVAPGAEAAGVSLIVDPARCGSCLRADADQLVQVLVNLLQNAVEASAAPEAGERHVALRIRRGRGRVIFTVVDSGEGLKQTQLAQLVRPFFSTKQNGTGLGLSVARQIVEQHGGQLTLVDRREGGAAAEVTLPDSGENLP